MITNRESHQENLKVLNGFVPTVVHSVWDGELAVDLVQHDILSTCHQNSQLRWLNNDHIRNIENVHNRSHGIRNMASQLANRVGSTNYLTVDTDKQEYTP
jgi:hypothetical protein